MDPLSITVSTITLLGLVRKTVQASKAFTSAPEQLDSLLNDLTDAHLLLRDVELSLQTRVPEQGLPAHLRHRVCDNLKEAKQQLEDLEQVSATFTSKDYSSRNVKNSARWVRAKGKIERFKGKLESVCESLRESLGSFKMGCIELELQNVSVGLVEASAERRDSHDALVHGIDEIVRTQNDSMDQQAEILQKLTRLESYMHTENVPAPEWATRSPKQDEKHMYVQKYERIAVRATQRKAMCDIETCACHCHRSYGQHSPQTLGRLLGSIFAGYVGQPTSLKPCSDRFCRRAGSKTSEVTYYFPRWWFAHRMLGLVADMSLKTTNDRLPTPPRIVPATARIFRHAARGEVEVIRAMFATGLASPTDTDAETGHTPLHYAVDNAEQATIGYLLNRGADRHQKSFEGISAMGSAWSRLLTNSVSVEKRRILELTCDEEDMKEFDFTDLHLAVLGLSHTSVEDEIKALVRRTDVTIDDYDSQGRSAVSWAAQRGDLATLRLLLEYGASPEAPKGLKTPLHYAAGTGNSAAIVNALIEHKADPRAADIAALNGLMWACVNYNRRFDSIPALLAVSDLEQTDINGRTAIFHAASTHLIPTMKIIEAGANVNHADKDGYTALHMAIYYHHPECLLALNNAHANMSTRTSNGQTLLHHAALHADPETLQALLYCQLIGLDINALDHEDCTPRDRISLRTPQPSVEIRDAFDRLLIHISSLQAGLALRGRNPLITSLDLRGARGRASSMSTLASPAFFTASGSGITTALDSACSSPTEPEAPLSNVVVDNDLTTPTNADGRADPFSVSGGYGSALMTGSASSRSAPPESNVSVANTIPDNDLTTPTNADGRADPFSVSGGYGSALMTGSASTRYARPAYNASLSQATSEDNSVTTINGERQTDPYFRLASSNEHIRRMRN